MAAVREAIDRLVEKLRRVDAQIVGFELGEPMPADRPALIVSLGGAEAPPILMNFYQEMDGASMMWVIDDKKDQLTGGFNLQSSFLTLLRSGAEADSEPLEGILWTGDEEPDELALLRRMVIFDSVPGRNDFLTFLIDEPDRVFLVAENVVTPLFSSLEETLDVVLAHGGADGVRGHLAFPDWRERVAADLALKRFRAL